MSLSVKFNRIELSEYIDVLQGFTPFSGANWAPEVLSDEGITRGTDFKYTTYKSKTIPMPFTVSGNINGKYDELQKILNVNEPKELVFGNTPDRFCYAIPVGDFDFEDWECLGEGSITWLVPDGLAHSTVEKTFSATANGGVLEATIVNGGTEAVPVDYTITHNHENGYIGIVSEYGVIQLGSPDEVDAEVRQKSQVLINYRNSAEMGAMVDGQGVLTENFPKNGTFKTVTINGQNVLALNNVGSGSSWHGASRMVTLPADSNGEVGAVNFLAQSHIWFETGKVQQTGLLEFVVGDEAGQPLASIHIFKKATNANTACAIMQINLQEKKRVVYEPHSKSVTANGTGSKIYIRKIGELFEFYFGGAKYQFRVPALANKKAKTLTIFLGQWGSLSAGNVVARMYFHNVLFQRDNVNYWYDIPNRYRAGSTVYIDGAATKVYVDGIPSLDDEVHGSTYFHAPPGETKVQFYYSDFSDPGPTVTAKIREAFL